MSLINWEINLILTWSANYVTSCAIGATILSISDTEMDVQVVILSTQDKAKLLQ